MFITASWVESVKQEVGVSGVSPVWDDQPIWYVWVESAPGPFALSLEQTDFHTINGETLISGQFALKCYPWPTNLMFSVFSKAERQAILSGLFDRTNTPVLETRDQIRATDFGVGALTIVLDPKADLFRLTFDSLDYLRERHLSESEPNDMSMADEREIIRCVPGWKIGALFFERFVALRAFYSKQNPFKVGICRSPGFETIKTAQGNGEIIAATDLSCQSISVLFKQPRADLAAAKALWRDRLEADDQVVMDDDGDQYDHREELADFPLAHLWRRFADMEAHSHLSSTCGCDAHHD